MTSTEEELAKLDIALKQLDDAKDTIKNAKDSIRAQAKEISGLSVQQQALLKEYEVLKGELEKISRVAVGDGMEIKIEDMQAALAIYRVLIEEIWQGQPHFKVLYLLHGDADELHIDKLKGATGISPAMVIHACQELAKVNLVSYDIETKKVKLIKRLFPKREKKKNNP